MTPPRRRSVVVAGLAAAVLAASGCTGDGPAQPATASSESPAVEDACAAVVGSLVATAQYYVDGYSEEGVAAAVSPEPSRNRGERSDAALQSALAQAQRLVTERRCDADAVQEDLEAGLDGLTSTGSVADAVLRRLRVVLSGTADAAPTTTSAGPGDDLADAVAGLAPRSTLILGPGTYEVPGPLVILQGVEIRGAGPEATVVTSTGGEAVVLVLTDERVRLTDLRVQRTGTAVGSVVLGGPSAALDLEEVVVTGGVADADGTAGAGVLMASSGAAPAADRRTTLQVTRSRIEGNGSAGVVLGGGHRAGVEASEFTGNGRCGVCFLESSDGTVRGSTFRANPVGVAVSDEARPSLVANVFDGGEVGVRVGGSATPSLEGNVVTGATRAGLVWTDGAAGQAVGTLCSSVPHGIVVGPAAVPFVDGGDCAVARSG